MGSRGAHIFTKLSHSRVKRKNFLSSLKRARFSGPSVCPRTGCGNYLLPAYSSRVSRRMSTVYHSLCKR